MKLWNWCLTTGSYLPRSSAFWSLAVCLLAFLLFFYTPIPVTAAQPSATQPPSQDGLIIVLVNSLDPLEVANDPIWRDLATRGAYGLMNVRVGGRMSAAATHLSLGSKTRADAPIGPVLALEADEYIDGLPAAALYHSLTGATAEAHHLVYMGLGKLMRLNAPGRTDAPVGWLGDQLHAAGSSVALIGNSDTVDKRYRNGALMVMNSQGIVPQGRVSKQLLTTDPLFPYGLRTDYTAMNHALHEHRNARLLVVELGDLARLDAYRDDMVETVWTTYRKQALQDSGAYICSLLESPIWQHRSVLVLAPTPRADRIAAGQWLTPALLLHPGGTHSGLLHSKGTKRPGIVLNTEIASAVLTLTATGDLGPLRTTPHTDTASYMASQYQRIEAVHTQRAPLLRTYVIYSIGVFVTAWLALWAASHGWIHVARMWSFALHTVAAFPLAALFLPFLNPRTTATALLLVAALTVLLTGLARSLGRRYSDSFMILLAATCSALLVDVVRGAPLLRWSLLGYDVIGGSRFYGIGNEYGGVLLASTIMLAGLIRQRWQRRTSLWLTGTIFLVTALVTGSPWWGANNGVAAAAILGFTCTFSFISGTTITWRHTVFAGALLVLSAIGAITLDLWLRPSDPSHLGALAQQVLHSGWQPVLRIAERKLAMNWKLLKYTIWTNVLVVSLVVSLVLLIRPLPWIRQQLAGESGVLYAAAKGALITAMFLLVLNDSGVVAAATAMIPVTTLLLAHTMALYRWRAE